MTAWEGPGEGWRQIGEDEDPIKSQIRYYDEDAKRWHRWARVESVPPLPAAPYTVIRVEWKRNARAGATDELAFFGGDWIDVDGTAYTSAGLRSSISGFEVLSEPRALTARAVLDCVWDQLGVDDALIYSMLAHEFGVES